MEEITTNGEKDQGETGNQDTAESSATSLPSASPRTRKTSELTLEQARIILQQSLRNYQEAGGKVIHIPRLVFNGDVGPAIFLPGANFEID
jgi:hypothetical protein